MSIATEVMLVLNIEAHNLRCEDSGSLAVVMMAIPALLTRTDFR